MESKTSDSTSSVRSGTNGRTQDIMYKVVSVSDETAVGKVGGLLSAQGEPWWDWTGDAVKKRRRKWWGTTQNSGVTLVIELEQRALVSYLLVDNKTTFEIDVDVAMDDGPRTFLPAVRGIKLRHNRIEQVKLHHLPCAFLRIHFTHGSPISLFKLAVIGIPTSMIAPTMGPTLGNLLVDKTERILYGPSLKASLPQTHVEAKQERLPTPDVRVPVDMWSNAPSYIDLLLKMSYNPSQKGGRAM